METATARKGELTILDGTGDTKLIWDPDNEAEVANARRTFDELVRKRFMAYKVDKKGEKGELITAFDPAAEKIILAPQLRGG